MSRTVINWKWISTFENEYMASDQGDICSFKKRTPQLLEKHTTDNGYEQVALYKNGKRIRFLVHDLIANTFVGIRPARQEVNHIDGNKLNNSASNLEFVTSSQNTILAYSNELAPKGENHGQSKLSREDVQAIRKLYPQKSQYQLASEYKVAQSTIGRIISHKTWKT